MDAASKILMQLVHRKITLNKGVVRVYNWDGTSWNQKGADFVGTCTSENRLQCLHARHQYDCFWWFGDNTNGAAPA
jgi:hypothetical protein